MMIDHGAIARRVVAELPDLAGCEADIAAISRRCTGMLIPAALGQLTAGIVKLYLEKRLTLHVAGELPICKQCDMASASHALAVNPPNATPKELLCRACAEMLDPAFVASHYVPMRKRV